VAQSVELLPSKLKAFAYPVYKAKQKIKVKRARVMAQVIGGPEFNQQNKNNKKRPNLLKA
jgi:hypothetical protein